MLCCKIVKTASFTMLWTNSLIWYYWLKLGNCLQFGGANQKTFADLIIYYYNAFFNAPKKIIGADSHLIKI
jgi:hypothetical protein